MSKFRKIFNDKIMKIGNDWWTSPTESESGALVMVTGRRGVEQARESGKYKIRVEITWKYPGNSAGMPMNRHLW